MRSKPLLVAILDHDVLAVVLDEVESLAGCNPGAIQVKSVPKHDTGGLEAGGRGRGREGEGGREGGNTTPQVYKKPPY